MPQAEPKKYKEGFPDFDGHFSNIDKAVRDLKNALNEIKTDKQQADQYTLISNIMDDKHAENLRRNAVTRVEGLLEVYQGFAGSVKDFQVKCRSDLTLEFALQKTRSWENEKLQYIGWLNKIARWSLGAVFAVILYSLFVLAEESFRNEDGSLGFIRVPVKDLISPVH